MYDFLYKNFVLPNRNAPRDTFSFFKNYTTLQKKGKIKYDFFGEILKNGIFEKTIKREEKTSK